MANRPMTEAAPLAGLAVAVTRPTRQNDALVQQLRALGASVSAIPLLAINPLQEPAQRAKIDTTLQQLADYQIAIFISQNAAEQVLLALAARSLDWPSHIQTYAIGSATTQFLATNGISATSPLQMNSEGLLALPALQHVAGQRCVIFRGLGGRETLAQTLRARGAVVDYCELSCRQLPPEAGTQWSGWIAGLHTHSALVCINSTETLNHLCTIDPDAAARNNLTLLVPGERVARAASEAGFRHMGIASDATDAAILHSAILQAAISRTQRLHAATTGIRHD